MNASTSTRKSDLLPFPPRLLVTGPPGSGKSKFALDLFDAAVRADGPDAALLLLPTYGEVEHAKRLAISRRGDRPDVRGLLDTSYVTFTSLRERASSSGGSADVGLADGFRVRVLPSRRRRDVLADEALRASDAALFRAVRDRAGFRSRFLRLVKELKQTGEAPASLLARARAASRALDVGARERLTAFLDGWEHYEAALVRAGTPDHEDSLRALVDELAVTSGAALFGVKHLIVDGFDDFSGIEVRLLDAVGSAVVAAGGRVVVTLPWDDARSDLYPSTAALRARLVTGKEFVEERLLGFSRAASPALQALASNLFAPNTPASDAGPAPDSDGVRALVGADPADEWDRIGREILRLVRAGNGTGFRDVGVVVRRMDGVATTARRAFERLGIPVRLVGGGESLASEPLVRALRGPLRLLAGDTGAPTAADAADADDRDFDAHGILDHLRWRALDSGAPLDVDAVDTTDLRWRTKRFPATWQDVLDDFAAHARETLLPTAGRLEELRVEALRVEATTIGDASVFLERVIGELSPLRSSAGFDGQGRPLDPAGDARLARTRAAKRRLLALVAEARSGATAAVASQVVPVGRSPTLRAAIDELLDATNDAACEPADRRLDAVSVLDAEEARHWELPVVFVAGLVEKGFPLHPREDLFLRDEDREALATELARENSGAPDPWHTAPWRTAREAEVGERRLFLSAVTRARTLVVLSRASRDESGREAAPSFFWRDVAHALGREADGATRFGGDPADLDRTAPPLVDVATEDDLRRYVASSDSATGYASDALVSSWLARAARFRRGTEDALPPSATAAFLAATAKLPPSKIQAALDCPHRFFLANVARVPDDDAPLRGTAADRLRFGIWLHAVLERAVRDKDATDAEIVEAALDDDRAYVPDGADRAWYAEDLRRVLALFRVREAAAKESGYAPGPGDVEIDFAKVAKEVHLGSGAGAFVLTGRIDRLDTHSGEGAKRAIVVDYKATAGTASNAARDLRRVEELQLALYARAIENVRGVTVVGLEHYAATSPLRAATADERAAAAFAARREGKPATLLSTADFREKLLGGAERRASEVVAFVRRGAGGGHRKLPLARGRCARCAFEAVCRPDKRLFSLIPLRPDDAALEPDLDEDEGDDS